jgi:polysaccharide export outer membrane protein
MGTRSHRSLIVALLWSALVVAGPTAQSAPKIAPRDVLKIAVERADSWSRPYTVDADGTIDFPELGRVQASGKTARELQAHLVDLLKTREIMVNPRVTIDLEQVANKKVTVAGPGVGQPGTFAFAGELTIMEALLRAGSTRPDAAAEALVIRPAKAGDTAAADDAVTVLRVNLRALQGPEVASHNILIEDGDQVIVNKAEQVFIDGYVRSPGPYSIEPGMTVAKALTLAGGVTELGASNRITIKRTGADGKPVTIPVDRDKIDSITVQPGDLIVVPKRRM